ncbi:MAG: glycosyltransferase family 2 protein [Desulfurococcaceae archaeon]|nr:glycosyltransferase family 2 protein [Desulfurococcaceae archaeon]
MTLKIDLYTLGLVGVALLFTPQVFVYLVYSLLVLMGRGKSRKLGEYALKSAHDISFILPVRNEPLDYVERAIKRICELRVPGQEIIVVSDDDPVMKNEILEVVSRAQSSGCNVWFIWRSVPRGARTGAVNVGLFASRNPYVYIVDVDTYPERCFIDLAVSILESSSEYACVVGRWEPLNYESRLSAALAAGLKYMTTVLYRARSRLGLYTYPLGTGTLFNSSVLKNTLGGWDERRVQDDMEIGARIMHSGLRVAYIDDCAIYVENPSSYRAFRVQQYRWAYGALDTAISRAKQILCSKYPLIVRLDAFFYLLQYTPQVLAFIGGFLLATVTLTKPLDYVLVAFPLLVVYAGSMLLHSLVLYRETLSATQSTWDAVTQMGRLAAVTSAISLYTLLGTLRALFRIKTEYKRTPKGVHQRLYSQLRVPWELLLGLVFLASSAIAVLSKAYITAIVLLLHAATYLYILARYPRDVFYK